MFDRAVIEVETLLKAILALAVVWLVLEVAAALLRVTFVLLRLLPTLAGIAIVLLVVLYLKGRL